MDAQQQNTLTKKLFFINFFPTFFFKFFISGNRLINKKRSFIDQLDRVLFLFSLSSIMINTHKYHHHHQDNVKKSIAIISGLRKSIILFCLLSAIAQKQKSAYHISPIPKTNRINPMTPFLERNILRKKMSE